MNTQSTTPAPEDVTAAIPQPAHFPWRLFWLLGMLMLLASLMLLPYALRLLNIGQSAAGQSPVGLSMMAILGSLAQTIFIYWPVALLGLLAAGRLGLGAPFLAALVGVRPVLSDWRRMLVPAVLVGFGAGILLLLLSALLSPLIASEMANQNNAISSQSMPNAWQGFLASISAGINEEILLRLGLLSGLAWLLQRILLRRSSGRPAGAILWTANLLAALIFGLLHIPNLTAIGVPVSSFMVVYIILLNGLAGLAYGKLFWTYGLESAMLAHFFTDIVLHVITVPLQNLPH